MKPVYDNQQVIGRLDSGQYWLNSGSLATEITYSIPTNSGWYPNDRVVFDDLNISDITIQTYDYGMAANGNSLRLLWNDGSSSGELRIGPKGQYIEEFEFANGTLMTADDFVV